MAVAFGKVSAFNPSQDEWPLYVERLGHVFVANGITEEPKKRAIFLSVIGASNYKLLSSLVAPAKPGEKEYTELVEKLSANTLLRLLQRLSNVSSFTQGLENLENQLLLTCLNYVPLRSVATLQLPWRPC